MNLKPSLAAICTLPWLASLAYAAESTGNAFYGDAPDAHHPWAIHDRNRPQPPVVTPGTFSSEAQPGTPPSDAVILFDGTEKSLANWEADKNPPEPTKWEVKDGILQCVPKSGYIRTKEEFGDIQLHVEWASPTPPSGDSQGRGNSGVFLMGRVEVQVLDNYNNPTYADGFASAIYGVNPPFVNALRPPGQWEVYDIVFRRPIYKDGKVVDPGYVTVFVNGVLTQDHTRLEGGTGHKARSTPGPFPEKGPLKLQDHGNPVRYRNIWYRPLPARSVEGGTDGPLTEEAAKAKRHEIAASVRESAAKLQGQEKLLRLLESFTYESDDATAKEVSDSLNQFVDSVKQLPEDKATAKKSEANQLVEAVNYLAKFKLLPADFAAKDNLLHLVSEKGWDKKGPNKH